MRQQTTRQRKIVGVTVMLAGILVGFFGFMAVAQTPNSQAHNSQDVPAAGLIGASVFSSEGTEVGTVSVVTIGQDGYISEIRFTRSPRLGLEERTVAVYPDSFTALDGAVVLDLSADDVDELPVQAVKRGTAA